MNKLQFRRWQDFSLRMAATAFSITRRRKVKLLREIRGMFDYIHGGTYRDRWMPNNWRTLTSWDDSYNGLCFCDWFDNWFEEYHGWNRKEQFWSGGKFASMLHCCIRSGLDLASAPSGGVVGFKKKDIVRMYPRGVPAWIQQDWNRPWVEIPDNAGLWL